MTDEKEEPNQSSIPTDVDAVLPAAALPRPKTPFDSLPRDQQMYLSAKRSAEGSDADTSSDGEEGERKIQIDERNVRDGLF